MTGQMYLHVLVFPSMNWQKKHYFAMGFFFKNVKKVGWRQFYSSALKKKKTAKKPPIN